MKRETHQFAKGRKNNWRNKYNHVWLYLYLLIDNKLLDAHRDSNSRSLSDGWVCGIAPYQVCRMATQGTWYKQFVKLGLLAVASCHPSKRPSGAAETPLGC